jgi:hypothetical protein
MLYNKRFGRLLCIRPVNANKQGNMVWYCLCDCGGVSLVPTNNLTSGHTRSCGCLNFEAVQESNLRHGGNRRIDKKERLYQIWATMKSRCLNKNNSCYRRYGGRGIIVCDSWSSDYSTFREWAIGNGYKNNLTIDRIDNDSGYCPSNCQWITGEENSRKGNKKMLDNDKR